MKCNFMNSLTEFLNLDNDEKRGEEHITGEEFDEISFNHVSFKYSGTKNYIPKDINLTIHKGERLFSRKFCDRIIVIGDKRIQEKGTQEELMKKNGLYAKMFSTQAKWYVE